jgi:hypothetical protein
LFISSILREIFFSKRFFGRPTFGFKEILPLLHNAVETIHHQLKRARVPLTHYETTLHALVTKESREIIEQYKGKSEVDVFFNRIDHQPWYRIPFG